MTNKLKLLDLFSGLGGFSLGLERTGGFETVAFCEIEKFPQKVLRKHWPNVPIYEDVRTLSADKLRADGISVDCIAGGFPCQDISTAGKGAGLAGERSGLWFEFHRLIKEIKPSWVIIENVSALRSRGLDEVLRSLFEIGYDAEWNCIPASALGAPHQRDRIWIISYPNKGLRNGKNEALCAGWDTSDIGCADVADSNGERQLQSEGSQSIKRGWIGNESKNVRNSMRKGLEGQWSLSSRIGTELKNISDTRWWETEPNVGRVAHGVPNRVDRLKCLGNAVVPQIPELIGYAILNSMERHHDG